MKLLFILLIPVFSIGQTVHIKDDKIVYEGRENIPGLSAEEIFRKVQKTLPGLVRNYSIDKQSVNSVRARGEMKLKTPYPSVRSVSYFIAVHAEENCYEYKLDSVFFKEKERGGKEVTKSSTEVIDGISETGRVVGETEKVLNETDMKFQRLLALLRSEINKN
jgi:hypothetical protein